MEAELLIAPGFLHTTLRSRTLFVTIASESVTGALQYSSASSTAPLADAKCFKLLAGNDCEKKVYYRWTPKCSAYPTSGFRLRS